jgi:hypothetical protein
MNNKFEEEKETELKKFYEKIEKRNTEIENYENYENKNKTNNNNNDDHENIVYIFWYLFINCSVMAFLCLITFCACEEGNNINPTLTFVLILILLSGIIFIHIKYLNGKGTSDNNHEDMKEYSEIIGFVAIGTVVVDLIIGAVKKFYFKIDIFNKKFHNLMDGTYFFNLMQGKY